MAASSGDYMKSSRPLYYGGAGATSGGSGRGPAYYGGTAYGGSAYYYGGGAYGSSGGSSGGDDSMLGALTAGRILRVVAQRWILVLVALLIGLVVAFAVYRISPTIYEATSEFTMDMKRPSMNGSVLTAGMEMPDLGNTFEEVLNTRMADWRSDKVVAQIVAQYRANYPNSTVSDEELATTLQDSKIDLVRHSRLITISVRSKNPTLAAALANAYAKAIESFTEEDAKVRIDKAVAQLAVNTEKKGREVDATE